jgi:hypothetical protein
MSTEISALSVEPASISSGADALGEVALAVRHGRSFSVSVAPVVSLNAKFMKTKELVRKGGFEPPRLSAPPPQDGVSASSTTSALYRSTLINILATSAKGIANDSAILRATSHAMRSGRPKIRAALMLPCRATSCNVEGSAQPPTPQVETCRQNIDYAVRVNPCEAKNPAVA